MNAGSGYHANAGMVSREWICSEPTPQTGYKFRQVPNPCPKCPGSLTAGTSVARNESNSDLPCGARVFVYEMGIRTIQDTGARVAVDQLDHYAGTTGCTLDGGDHGTKKTIRLY